MNSNEKRDEGTVEVGLYRSDISYRILLNDSLYLFVFIKDNGTLVDRLYHNELADLQTFKLERWDKDALLV